MFVAASTSKGGGDIETGGMGMYPAMTDNPEFRWQFIRKVYCIVSVQLCLTAVVAGVISNLPDLIRFIVTTIPGIAIYIVVVISPFIIMCPLFIYRKSHPANFILLGLFTVAIAFSVGMSCAFVKGKIILEALILTAVMVVSLTVYTFWAAKRGQDFSFLGPFLFAGLMMLMMFSLIQIFLPLGKLSMMLYGLLAAIIFSGFIIYDTYSLLEMYTYDEYIAASVTLYMDIINLFLALLAIFNGMDD